MIKQWKKWCSMCIFIGVGIVGCSNRWSEKMKIVENESNSDIVDTASKTIEEEILTMKSYQEVVQYMINSYGLDKEELYAIDVLKFAKDYEIYERTYTPEEMRELLEDVKIYYEDDGTTALFSIFDCPDNGGLDYGVQINRIGYYRNKGTLIERIICDLRQKEVCVDIATPFALTEEQTSILEQLPFKYDIPSWENHYEGEEVENTGSFRWKLVFECDNGNLCAYGGYTSDGSHLPEHFVEVEDTLMKIAHQVQ